MGRFLSPERANYYKAKRQELKRKSDAQKIIHEDALYIKHYGMSAYLELFPEAKDFGTNWHSDVLQELIRIERRALANKLSGISMAVAAGQSKKAARSFKKVIKDMLK